MTRSGIVTVFIGLAIMAAPAWGWGPNTRLAAVTTAMHVLSKQGVAQLNRLERDVLQGATAPPETVSTILPDLNANPFRAIETEMRLLAAVRGKVVDAYFAYRLGLLGSQVAELTGPLSRDRTGYRDRYYADVDRTIQSVPLKPSVRKIIDPVPYLARLQEEADLRRDMIVKDYQEGTGFAGVAGASIAEDATRSVNAVADVWYTILTGTQVQAAVSESQLREYVLGALRYYISRGNEREIESSYARLIGLAPRTADMAKRLGDMFYEAKMYERAMDEYRYVLQQEPNRRDVVEKMANHYIAVGDAELKEDRLRQALDAFTAAAKIDPLHPYAEAKRLEAEKLIAQREARLDLTRKFLEDAAKLQTQAEQYVMEQKHAEALATLKKAQELYENVTEEFPVEYQAASAGLANISARLRQIKTDLIQNAQALSGAGTLVSMKQILADSATKLNQQALRSLLNRQLDSELSKLKGQYEGALEIKR